MLARTIILGALIIGPMSLSPVAAIARDNGAVETRWQFAPEIGLEGRAHVAGDGPFRLEVECGNGGGPTITLLSSSPFALSREGAAGQVLMKLDIDGKRFEQIFECYPGGTRCESFGIPFDELMTAMRQGSQMTLRYGDIFRAPFSTKFTLAGSDAAISRLSACLGQ